MSIIYAFSKAVKDTTIKYRDLQDDRDIIKIGEVIEKLELRSDIEKLNINELDLRTNPKRWAISLLNGYPYNVSREVVENLITDFTDSMKTRMREESKYAIGLLILDKLILCHSVFGEETITPEWQIIQRMLDADNILRYVCFEKSEEDIFVKFWEKEATSSFVDWLGLPRKQAFLFGGSYRLRGEVENMVTEFQLTEDDIKTWVDEHPELEEGKINFSSPIQYLNINEIRVGHKKYERMGDFLQDYVAESYGLLKYQGKYKEIMEEMLPLLIKYYDEKTRLVRKEGDEEILEISKTLPNFDVFFTNHYIEIRYTYVEDLIKRCLNNEPINIYHAGVEFTYKPLQIGNIKIYNKILFTDLINTMIKYFENTNLQDKYLISCIKYAIFHLLAYTNEQSPISYLFERISQGISHMLKLMGGFTKLEGQILEYKSKDILTEKTNKVVEKLTQDFSEKLNVSHFKIYFIGVEDDGSIDSIPKSRISSSRIQNITNSIESKLKSSEIHPMILKHGTGYILMLIVNTKTM